LSAEKKFSVGDSEITLLSDGLYRLDGGAMFGVVPKTMWEKRIPADENNRIGLGLISALVRTAQETILIEAGVGDHFDRKKCEIYCIDHTDNLLKALSRAGLKTGDIDRVILSHMHFDHIGHNTRRTESGEFVPTFENAEYVFQKTEYDFANDPPVRVKASYIPYLWKPIEESGQLRLIDGDVEIAPGIRSIVTGGHTKGHQTPDKEPGATGAIFWGDLIPTSAHVDYPFIMGYDLWPLDTLKSKEKFIPYAIENDYLSIWTHEPVVRYGKILPGDGKRHEFEYF
jgi:glyoxylase-like metal-dependent hydrolase (beta-lactamase superfamily II)